MVKKQLMQSSEVQALQNFTSDGKLILLTRIIRSFAYGFLSIVLVLYLKEGGLQEQQIGLLLSLTLLGDSGLSLLLTCLGDRIGRRHKLILGAVLMIGSGIVFTLSGSPLLLMVTAVISTISPGGNDVGPFIAIEQAVLPQTICEHKRTQAFAWYSLVGSLAAAMGALCSGNLSSLLQQQGNTSLVSYRIVIAIYTSFGFLLVALFSRLSPAVETKAIRTTTQNRRSPRSLLGLHRSRGIVFKMSGLFMLDAFAGGMVVQSLIAYWLYVTFKVNEATIGSIFFAANLLTGFSALIAARLASRFGLVNTIIWTHVPANLLLISLPLMPSLPLAIAALLARYSITQMNYPARQAFLMAIVDPDERSAALGATTIARSAAGALAPVLAGSLLQLSLFSVPFFLAGGIKILYDLTLWGNLRSVENNLQSLQPEIQVVELPRVALPEPLAEAA